jgi:hypothetical protein
LTDEQRAARLCDAFRAAHPRGEAAPAYADLSPAVQAAWIAVMLEAALILPPLVDGCEECASPGVGDCAVCGREFPDAVAPCGAQGAQP